MENSGRDEQPARADHGVRRGQAGGHADTGGGPPAPRRPGGRGPGAIPTRPFGPAPADLPGRLHAARSRPGSALRAPSLEQAITALASLCGETIVSNGGDAANWLGLTTQNAVRTVYLASGPDRLLHFGAHQVKLLDAPRWQLAAAHGTAGTVIRAISWLAPREVERSLDAVLPKLSLALRSHLTPGRSHAFSKRQ